MQQNQIEPSNYFVLFEKEKHKTKKKKKKKRKEKKNIKPVSPSQLRATGAHFCSPKPSIFSGIFSSLAEGLCGTMKCSALPWASKKDNEEDNKISQIMKKPLGKDRTQQILMGKWNSHDFIPKNRVFIVFLYGCGAQCWSVSLVEWPRARQKKIPIFFRFSERQRATVARNCEGLTGGVWRGRRNFPVTVYEKISKKRKIGQKNALPIWEKKMNRQN